MKNKKIYFSLISLPRSGSTLLSETLNFFQNVKCFKQSFFEVTIAIIENFFKIKLKKKKKIILDGDLLKNKIQLSKFLKFVQNDNYIINKNKQNKNSYGDNFKIYKTQKKEFNYSEFYKLNLSNNTKKNILGSKEVNSDYFIDYYLSNNIKVILLVRNPFDYIYSCMFGKKNYINKKKYSINHFLLRWKYLYKKYNKSEQNLLIIKFEDLILNRQNEFKKISTFLGTKIKKKMNINIQNSSHHQNLKHFDKKVIYNSLNNLDKKLLFEIFKKTKNELFLLGYISSLNNFKNSKDLKNELLKEVNL